MFLLQPLPWQKPTFAPEDSSGYPMCCMLIERWWDLPNLHTNREAWTITGYSISLLTITIRGRDMENRPFAFCFNISETIIPSVRRFNSPSIQKMIAQSASTLALAFNQRVRLSAESQSIGVP